MNHRLMFGVAGFLLSQAIGVAQVPEKEGSGEIHDDPRARAQYERMRLTDPATGEIPPSIRRKELAFAAKLPTKESLAGMKPLQGRRTEAAQSLSWSRRGPANVGGRTRALAVDITDPSVILAGGVSGGMWRSSNGGSSWTKVTALSDLQSVTCIAQDPRPGHTAVWYYGTGEAIGNSAGGGPGFHYTGDGIFKSTDGGLTWTSLPSTASGTPEEFNQLDFIYAMAVDPADTLRDVVYAAIYGGIARSTDGGGSWSIVLGDAVFSFTSSLFTDIAVSTSGVLYATLSQATVLSYIYGDASSSASRGIYRSVDGVNWTKLDPAGWPAQYNRVVLDIAPSYEDVVYFLGDTPGSGLHYLYNGTEHNWTSFWKYVYLSGDGTGPGGAWLNRSANLPAGFYHHVSYDLVVGVKPDNENAVFIGGVSLYRSTDGFSSTLNTQHIGAPFPEHHVDQHALVFPPGSPTTLLSGNDGGVYRTTDNLATFVDWVSLNGGYETSQYYTVAIDHGTAGDNTLIGGTQDNGTWFTNAADPGAAWLKIDVGDGAHCAIADGRTSYYTSWQNGRTYRRILDGSGTQTGWTRVDPTGASGYLFINPFVLDPNNTARMYLAGGTSLWRNNDLTGIPMNQDVTTAVNWTKLTNTTVASGTISAVAVSRSPGDRVYYGTSAGSVYRLDSAASGNPLPVNVTGGAFPPGAYVSCIAVDPADAGRTMVVFSNYGVPSLFMTTDGGTSWANVSGNLEENPNGSGSGPSCRWAAIVPGSGYFLGASTGLYSTPSLGGSSTTWAQEGSAIIGNAVVDMIDTRQQDGLIVAATHGAGVYSANVNILSMSTAVRDQWNLVSVPLGVDDYAASTLYPTAVSGALAYAGNYAAAETLAAGQGYWMKFAEAQSVPMIGSPVMVDTIEVSAGWNLIGSITVPVPVSSVVSDTPAMATSPFYGYEGTYATADTIWPGRGYWVKVGGTGSLVLAPTASPAMHAVTIVPGTEEPPLPPWQMRAQGSSDVFPLAPGLVSEYDYRLSSTWSFMFSNHYTIDSGSVRYTVLDSVHGDDNTISWQVRERRDLIRREGTWWTGDTGAHAILDSSVVVLTESILGRHELSCASLVWSFPVEDPNGSPLHIYRFADSCTTADSLDGSWMNASLSLSCDSGLVELRRSNWGEDSDEGGWAMTVSARLRGGTITAADAGMMPPAAMRLRQNYPNPFNPMTIIEFDVPAGERVALKVYDVLGREVATLADGPTGAGTHSVEWRPTNLPSGVYFCRMTAGGLTETRKLLLQR